jgi:hypothetical protein
MTLQALKSRLREFHRAEDGIEALQVVMICAIAAIILVAFATVGDDIFNWCREKVADLLDWDIG